MDFTHNATSALKGVQVSDDATGDAPGNDASKSSRSVLPADIEKSGMTVGLWFKMTAAERQWFKRTANKIDTHQKKIAKSQSVLADLYADIKDDYPPQMLAKISHVIEMVKSIAFDASEANLTSTEEDIFVEYLLQAMKEAIRNFKAKKLVKTLTEKLSKMCKAQMKAVKKKMDRRRSSLENDPAEALKALNL